jgi:glucose-6-phosphate-specific signal transduction histidine kinase
MRGVVVSIQVAILMAVILTTAIAVAGYLYTMLYSSLQYIYVAVAQAYAYPRDGGTEVKLCFMVGGSGG